MSNCAGILRVDMLQHRKSMDMVVIDGAADKTGAGYKGIRADTEGV